MSFYPSRRRPDYLPMGGPPSDPAGDRAFVAGWLDHVAAGRIGGNPPVAEEVRAVVLANERLICGDGTLPIG